MKRFFLSAIAVVVSSLAIALSAQAKTVNFNSSEADLNGDGVVSMTELHQYHLDRSTK